MKGPTAPIIIIILLLIMGIVLIPFSILPPDSWISPDGHIETEAWLNEENVYDGSASTETETANTYHDTEWGPTLTLIYSNPINATKIKIDTDAIPFRKWEIEIYRNNSWVRLYFGQFIHYRDNIYEFDHGLVTQIKISGQITDLGEPYTKLHFYLSEVQLYGRIYEEPEESPAPPEDEETPEDIPEENPPEEEPLDEEPLEEIPEETPEDQPERDDFLLQISAPILVGLSLIVIAFIVARKR